MSKSSKSRAWIGFDLGGTKMMAVVYNDRFKQLGMRRRKTKAYEGVRAGIDRIVDTVNQALEEAQVSRGEVAGMGIGCPGPLDIEKGILIDTPNMGWRNLPLKKLLEKIFGFPVLIANDVDAGVYGEYCFGAARKARCAIGVFPGTGIGGGCVYEGRLIRGEKNSCFEIGHMRVMPDGMLCGCGRHGCLETLTSRLAISAAIIAAAYRGEAPNLLKEVGLDLSNIRSNSIASAISAGDRAVEKIVRDAASWLGVGIGTVVNLMNPDVVVLGGGLVEAMPVLFKTAVEESARKTAMPSFEKSFKVAIAGLGDSATAMGAAALARDAFSDTKAGEKKK